MWILKGTVLGLWLFGFGTIALLYLAVYRGLPPHSAVGVTVITAYTIQNLWWWAALLTCLALGGAVARRWSGPAVLWIALLVTGLIPAGLLTLFIVLAVKVKQASSG